MDALVNCCILGCFMEGILGSLIGMLLATKAIGLACKKKNNGTGVFL